MSASLTHINNAKKCYRGKGKKSAHVKKPKQVVCKETGECFASLKEFAGQNKLNMPRASNIVRKELPFNGKIYEYPNPL